MSQEGGKTGITAIVTGIMFLISVFFAPIFASIPSWATGGALVIVGTLMIRNVRDINWDYIGDAVPAFLTIIIIPLTYKYASHTFLLCSVLTEVSSRHSIAYGVIAGIISYLLLNGIPWILRKVSNDRIVPPTYGSAEPWVIPPGSIVPGWMYVLRRSSSRSRR